MKKTLIASVIIGLIALLTSCTSITSDSDIAEQAIKYQYENGPIETYVWLQSKVDDRSINENDYDYIIVKLQESQR